MNEQQGSLLRSVRELMLLALQPQAEDRVMLTRLGDILNYLRVDMAFSPVEKVRGLFLNSKLRLICCELLSEGTIDQAPIHIREIAVRGLELNAAGLILAHNHPSGDPTPSRADIALTRDLAQALKPLGIILHDHLILGASAHASLREMGYL